MSTQLAEILKLSLPERVLLVEAIWDSIALETNPKSTYQLSAEHIAILEEELAAYAKNPNEGRTWDEVKLRYKW